MRSKNEKISMIKDPIKTFYVYIEDILDLQFFHHPKEQ